MGRYGTIDEYGRLATWLCSVVEIAADRFRRQGVGTAEAAQRVSSLSDNGQSVSFQAYAAESVLSSGLTESEMQALCAYRKLW